MPTSAGLKPPAWRLPGRNTERGKTKYSRRDLKHANYELEGSLVKSIIGKIRATQGTFDVGVRPVWIIAGMLLAAVLHNIFVLVSSKSQSLGYIFNLVDRHFEMQDTSAVNCTGSALERLDGGKKSNADETCSQPTSESCGKLVEPWTWKRRGFLANEEAAPHANPGMELGAYINHQISLFSLFGLFRMDTAEEILRTG